MTPMTNPSLRPLILNSSNLIVSRSLSSRFHILNNPLPPVHKDDISREQLKVLLYDEIMSFVPQPIT